MNKSNVEMTTPSFEFSIGTTPYSVLPASTASNTPLILSTGTNVADEPKCLNAARCVKVAKGPKQATFRGFSRERDAERISLYITFRVSFGKCPLLRAVRRSRSEE